MHLVISQLMVAAFQKGTQLNDSVATLALRTDVVGYMSTVSHAVCSLIRYALILNLNTECPIALFLKMRGAPWGQIKCFQRRNWKLSSSIINVVKETSLYWIIN